MTFFSVSGLSVSSIFAVLPFLGPLWGINFTFWPIFVNLLWTLFLILVKAAVTL